jgi:membrane protease YdiL (CAAX protease family)
MEPAIPSQPPPPPVGGRGIRPMSAFTATGWAIGATFAFLLLLKLTESLRSAASSDVVSSFLCQVAAYLLGLFLILRVHAPEASIRSFLGIRPTHPAMYAIGLALGAAAMIPANALFDLITKRYPLPDEDDTLSALYHSSGSPKRVLLAFIVIAFGPLLEEAFFRGALWKPLRAANAAALTILLTATLFAIAHINWQIIVPILFVGLLLGFLRSRSGSLFPSLFAHASFNAIPFYAMATGATDKPIPVAVVAGGTAAVALLMVAARFVGKRSQSAIEARKKDLA